VSLHPLAENFAGVADVYERGRPEYAPAVVGAMCAELGLREGARVLDLGAGTGKLTRALTGARLDVVAVEPHAPMRELLAQRAPDADVRDGVAEHIPLAAASVDAVTIADAFHWFDREPALAEIRRVLRPGGGLAVLSTVPDWTGASWAQDLGRLVVDSRPEHPHFDGEPWQQTLRATGDWSEPRDLRVTVARPADPERIVEHLASMSWVAGMEPAERERMLARMREIIASGTTPAEMPMHFLLGVARLEDPSAAAG
jgi:ubiquinone/menaquinone biosynthesis C-methylase UbiE